MAKEEASQGCLTSLRQFGLGLLFFFLAFPLLIYNEIMSLQTEKSLAEGKGLVVSISAENVDEANDGKLVHLSGPAVAASSIAVDDLGIEVEGLRLLRETEIFQWEETEREQDDDDEEKPPEYDYEQKWSEQVIDSDDFHNDGPKEFKNTGTIDYPSQEFAAAPITVGAFELSDGLVGQIDADEPFTFDDQLLSTLNEREGETWNAKDELLYRGENPDEPQIGDLKIEWKLAKPTDVSILAKQTGKTLGPYSTKAGDDLERLDVGIHTAKTMFAMAADENVTRTWLARGFGFAMFIAAFGQMASPFLNAAERLPIFGRFLSAGLALFSLLFAAGLSLITIGGTWLALRPLWAVVPLALALCPFVLLHWLAKRKRRAAGSEEEPEQPDEQPLEA